MSVWWRQTRECYSTTDTEGEMQLAQKKGVTYDDGGKPYSISAGDD